MPKLFLSGNPEADELLSNDPLALLCGMVLDQQVPIEKAFAGPHVLTERLGHDLNAAAIAAAFRSWPKRSVSTCGPANAFSIGTCWSSSMPISRASGDRSRTASAAASCARCSDDRGAVGTTVALVDLGRVRGRPR